jgi:tetratricopeptide (TPR) repeat protein
LYAVAVSLVLLAGWPVPSAGQEADPFYRKLIESGEKSYLSKNYTEAIRSLEIGIFGVSAEKPLQARGYVFLALCRKALGDKEAAAANLASAANLVGWDALRSMDLQAEAKAQLEQLLPGQSPAPAAPPTPAPKTEVLPSAAAPPATVPPDSKSPLDDLRRAIETDPRNAGPYYELALAYRENLELDKALKTLEGLIDRNPAEIRAHLEIGRIHYFAGRYKPAERALEKFLSLAANLNLEDRFRDEGRALLLLAASARGDKKKTTRLLTEFEELFRPDRLERLTLDASDLARLKSLRTTSPQK